MSEDSPAVVESRLCPVCGEPTSLILRRMVGGQAWDTFKPIECACGRNRPKRKAKERLTKAGLRKLTPDNARDYLDTWEPGINAEVKATIEQYVNDAEFNIENGYGLALIGPCQTGKTVALKALAQGLASRGYVGAHCTMANVLAAVRRSYDKEAPFSEAQVYSMLENADYLIIDEFGTGRVTRDWGVPTMFEIVNTAFDLKTPIIIASNFVEDELASIFEDTLLGEDRITPRIFQRAKTLYVNEHVFTNDVRLQTAACFERRAEGPTDG